MKTETIISSGDDDVNNNSTTTATHGGGGEDEDGDTGGSKNGDNGNGDGDNGDEPSSYAEVKTHSYYRLLVINPNSTQSMTDNILKVAKVAAKRIEQAHNNDIIAAADASSSLTTPSASCPTSSSTTTDATTDNGEDVVGDGGGDGNDNDVGHNDGKSNSNNKRRRTVAATAAATAAGTAPTPNNKIQIEVHGITNHSAPPAIQGPKDGELAIPGVLNIIQAKILLHNPEHYDGYLIACFDDIGLQESRRRQLVNNSSSSQDKSKHAVAITGIGEASYLQASKKVAAGVTAASAAAATVSSSSSTTLKNNSCCSSCTSYYFGVVTTVPEAVPVIEKNIQQLGLSSYCKKVVAAGIPVLELERSPQECSNIISQTIQDTFFTSYSSTSRSPPSSSTTIGGAGSSHACDDDDNDTKQKRTTEDNIHDDVVSVIVLGCAGMANVLPYLRNEYVMYQQHEQQPQRDKKCVVTFIEPISAGIQQLMERLLSFSKKIEMKTKRN